jgi:hypothetical protein
MASAYPSFWKSFRPEKLQLAPDVSIGELAMKYELTGGARA